MKPRKGETKLGVWFYGPEESGKRADDGHVLVDGRVQWVVGARYAVWKFRWTGSEWRRLRRETGPLKKSDADTRLKEIKSRVVSAG